MLLVDNIVCDISLMISFANHSLAIFTGISLCDMPVKIDSQTLNNIYIINSINNTMEKETIHTICFYKKEGWTVSAKKLLDDNHSVNTEDKNGYNVLDILYHDIFEDSYEQEPEKSFVDYVISQSDIIELPRLISFLLLLEESYVENRQSISLDRVTRKKQVMYKCARYNITRFIDFAKKSYFDHCTQKIESLELKADLTDLLNCIKRLNTAIAEMDKKYIAIEIPERKIGFWDGLPHVIYDEYDDEYYND
jgi:hypothetical protein